MNIPFEELVQKAHAFTHQVVAAAVAQGTPPHIVQTGNEITNGFMWTQQRCGLGHDTWCTKDGVDCSLGGGTWRPDDACGPNNNAQGNWLHFITLLNATTRAVRVASPSTKIMVHLGNWGTATWWLQNANILRLEPFDVLGVSYYEQFSGPTYGGPLNILQCNCSYCLSAVMEAYPALPIVIVETAWPRVPFSKFPAGFNETNAAYPFSPEGQFAMLSRLRRLSNRTFSNPLDATRRSLPTGVYWWCPECITRYWSGSTYGHQTLFDTDGVALPAQQAWGGGEWGAEEGRCEAALQQACPWAEGRSPGCKSCVAGHAPALQEAGCSSGALKSWCLDVYGLGGMACVE